MGMSPIEASEENVNMCVCVCVCVRDATFQEISWNQEIWDRKNFRKNETVSR